MSGNEQCCATNDKKENENSDDAESDCSADDEADGAPELKIESYFKRQLIPTRNTASY